MNKNILFVSLLLLAFAFPQCKKSKLDKKDKSLKQMQEEGGGHYEPVLAGADVFIYKTIDTTKMRVNVFYPANHHPGNSTPCVVFFFAGGFIQGSPDQYLDHCKYFSSRGIVAIAADYRVISRNKTTANECIYDAKSCVRWIREHADTLGIDPNKIIVGGGSAGGLLTIACAINDPAFEDAADNKNTSCVPDAMILWNPVVNTEEFNFRIQKFKTDPNADGAETSRAKDANPLTHVKSGMPPAIMFHGTDDDMSNIKYAQQFADAMKNAGDSIELHVYDGMEHGFAQPDRHDGQYYRETMQLTDLWLAKKGYLSGPPTIGN